MKGNGDSFLFSFAAALDPRRSLLAQGDRIIELGGNQVAFKESTQVITATMQPELDTTPVDGDLHFRRTAEGQAHVGATASFLLCPHDAFQTKCCITKKNAAQLPAAIAPIKVTWSAITFQSIPISRFSTKRSMRLIASSRSRLVAGLSVSSAIGIS